MKNIFFVLVITAGFSAAAQERISISDFKPLAGKWMGTLTYLDYTSGKPYTMPCNITVIIDKLNNRQFILDIEYPDEPRANGKDTVVISANDKMIDDEVVVSNEKLNSLTKIISERDGVDGNDTRKAVIRHVYEFGKKSFSKRKEVRFSEEEKWILRNEYKMNR